MTLPSMGCYPTEAHGLHLAYQEALYVPKRSSWLQNVLTSSYNRLGTPFEARGVKSLPPNIRAAAERAFLIKLNATQEALTV